MSLIISINSKEGIVIAADRRTTIRGNGGSMRFSDETTKIFPITERLAVSFCGNHYLNGDTIIQFLEQVKEKYKYDTDIFDFPSQLLWEYQQKEAMSDITIVVAGYDKKANIPMIYIMNLKEKTIKLAFSGNNYGATFHGGNDIADVIMKNIYYGDLSIREVIDLAKLTVDTTIQAYKYRINQSVGGNTDIFLIPKNNNEKSKWITNNHEIHT